MTDQTTAEYRAELVDELARIELVLATREPGADRYRERRAEELRRRINTMTAPGDAPISAPARPAQGITLQDAELYAGQGRGVVYRPPHLPADVPGEDGVVVEVRGSYVMVDYRGQVKATRPNDLEWRVSR